MSYSMNRKLLFIAAAYLYFIFRLSGLLSFRYNFTRQQFESSILATIYSILVAVWVTFFYPGYVLQYQAKYNDQVDDSTSPVNRKVYSLFTYALIIVCLLQLRYRNHLKGFLNRIIAVLQRISNEYPDFQVSIGKWITLNCIQSLTIHLTYAVIFINLPLYMVEDTVEDWLEGVFVIIPGAFFLLLTNCTTNILTILLYLFLKINGSLRSHHTTIDRKALEMVLEIHWELSQIVAMASNLLSHLVLSVFIYFFGVLIVEAYLIYVNIAEIFFLNKLLATVSLIESVVVLTVFATLLMIHVIVSTRCTAELKNTLHLLQEFERSFTDADVKKMYEMFIMRHILHTQSDFVVYDMLAVNYSLGHGMLSTIVSYVIVMVQLHISFVISK